MHGAAGKQNMRGHAILHVVPIMVFLVSCSLAVIEQSCSGDFSDTCSDVRLIEGGSQLQASCGDGQGSIKSSSLDLDEHITNNNGRLYCSGTAGAFSASCQSASLDASGTLTAYCLDVSGNLLQTQLNLDPCVQNSSGSLVWACL